MTIDLAAADELLATTRTLGKRLDRALPVAYDSGDDLRPAHRLPAGDFAHGDGGATHR